MDPRRDILVVFSTFIQFAEDRFERWFTRPRLVQSMRQQMQDVPERSEGFWALYWYRQLDSHPNANDHLWAYLQEPCYRAAEQITHRFTTVQLSVADGFQIAIAHVQRILQGYKPDYGSTLKAYAQKSFGNAIRDYLRQQHEIQISTNWGLLRRVSQTQLTEALHAAGYVNTAPAILLWKCFRAICTPTPDRSVRGLPDPSEAQLQAIAQRLDQESPDGSTSDFFHEPQQIMEKLIQLANLVRTYLNPVITSLNQPQYEDSIEEQLNTLIGEEEPPMVQLLNAEAYAKQQQQLQQIGGFLDNALTALSPEHQRLLVLYYQQKLTQNTIAQQLNIRQYQVSRQLNRIRRQLLLDVINWATMTLHTPSDCDVLENVSEVIHEWLQGHYSSAPPED
ncbi:MAG: sigma-70 family RNA polymerase sigma factor [Cyanobacteria bacterium J06642_11]